jgi:hypothetical protein
MFFKLVLNHQSFCRDSLAAASKHLFVNININISLGLIKDASIHIWYSRIMKTFNKNSMIIKHWNNLVLLVSGIFFSIINIAFLPTIIHDINQTLYIIPGVITWMIAVYLLIIGTFAEYRKNHQAPSLVFVSLRSNSPKYMGSSDDVYQKNRKSLLYETGWRYRTNDNKFVSKSKHC